MNERRRLEIRLIKDRVDVDLYLDTLGYNVVKSTDKVKWYFSPWREERTPSLAVYYTKKSQDWYDFGEKVGGSVIDLVQKLHGVSYVQAIQHLRRVLSI